MAEFKYVADNPRSDAPAAYTHVHLERAPTVNGAPGTFSEIQVKLIDAARENTVFTDLNGAVSSWYRHRWSVNGAQHSGYNTPLLAGDSLIRQRMKRNLKDPADLTDEHYDQWLEETILDLQQEEVGRIVQHDFTITAGPLLRLDIPAELQKILRIDLLGASGHLVLRNLGNNWEQIDRTLVVYDPIPGIYRATAIAEVRHLGDVEDELFALIAAGMRMRYLQYRIDERSNWKNWLTADPATDIRPEQLERMKLDAERDWDKRLARAKKTVAVAGT